MWNFLVFLAYWALFLWVAMPQGLHTELQVYPSWAHFTPAASNHDLIRLFGGADIASYARGAWDIHTHHGWFSPDGYWFMNLWAPGFFWLQAKIIKLLHLGSHKPFVVWLIVLTCGMWAATLTEVQRWLKQHVLAALAFLLPLALLASVLFREHFLAGGTVMTESISTACVLLAGLLGTRAASEKRIELAISAGIWLAIAAYLRAQVELYGSVLTVLVVILLLVLLVVSKTYRMAWQNNPLTRFKAWCLGASPIGPVHLLLLTVLVFQGLTLPYRLYTQQRSGSMAWNQSNYIWRFNWNTPAQLRAMGGGFYADGGMSTACDLNPELCQKINQTTQAYGKAHPGSDANAVFDWAVYRNDTLQAFLRKPFRWITHKLGFMPNNWMADMAQHANPSYAYWENLAFAGVVIAFVLVTKWQWIKALLMPVMRRRRSDLINLTPWIYAGALWGATIVFFLFVQIEGRYYFQLKMTAAVVMLMVVASVFSAKNYRIKD